MKPYCLKHIETGLYYKPGSGGTLSEKGKVYTTGGNYLSYLQNSAAVLYINPWEKVYKTHPELFNRYKHVYYSFTDDDGNQVLDYIIIPVTRECFVKEELNIEL